MGMVDGTDAGSHTGACIPQSTRYVHHCNWNTVNTPEMNNCFEHPCCSTASSCSYPIPILFWVDYPLSYSYPILGGVFQSIPLSHYCPISGEKVCWSQSYNWCYHQDHLQGLLNLEMVLPSSYFDT